MRKRYISLIVGVFLLIAVSVGVTYALLVTSSNAVVNAFTIGNVEISLEETTGDEYVITPGVDISKDPTVTVISNSEDCWLFVKIEKENDFHTFCTYEVADGWKAFDGDKTVFYRIVEKSVSDQTFSVLSDNRIRIKENLTEEQLNAITDNLTLKFTAYAVQKEGSASVEDAWRALNQ